KGLVWTSIHDNADAAGTQTEFVSIVDAPRAAFSSHPWSVGGGGAAEAMERIEDAANLRLGDTFTAMGRAAHTGSDEAYLDDRSTLVRRGIPECNIAPFVHGENVRDYGVELDTSAIMPYTATLAVLAEGITGSTTSSPSPSVR